MSLAIVRGAAFALVALVAVHLLGLFVLANESPVWFNGMFLIQRTLDLPVGAVGRAVVGIAFTIGALAVAWLWWAKASRSAALAVTAVAAWEVVFRHGQYRFVVDQGWEPGFLILFGLAMAGVSAVVAVVGLVATVAHHHAGRPAPVVAAA